MTKQTEEKPKTKWVMAKNVQIGALVILRGSLGLIDVASKTTTTRGNTRLSEKPILRPGNRRRRRNERRCIVVDPQTKMEVVK